jgi:hypothetical protein
MFLKKLNLTAPAQAVLADLQQLLDNKILADVWQDMNQLALNSQPTSIDCWRDGTGSLYSSSIGGYRAHEVDFTQWNIDNTWTVRRCIEELQEHLDIRLGRIRFMRLPPKTGLSVHKDAEVRYHLVLKTNPGAQVAHATTDMNLDRSELPTTASCYHLPLDNHWYELDTREVHWVYNGGLEERIHLVVCGV